MLNQTPAEGTVKQPFPLPPQPTHPPINQPTLNMSGADDDADVVEMLFPEVQPDSVKPTHDRPLQRYDGRDARELFTYDVARYFDKTAETGKSFVSLLKDRTVPDPYTDARIMPEPYLSETTGYYDLDGMVPRYYYDSEVAAHLSPKDTAKVLEGYFLRAGEDVTVPIGTIVKGSLAPAEHMAASLLAREAALGVEEEVSRVAAEMVMNGRLPGVPKKGFTDFWIACCGLEGRVEPAQVGMLSAMSGVESLGAEARDSKVFNSGGKLRFRVLEYVRPVTQVELDGLRLTGKTVHMQSTCSLHTASPNKLKPPQQLVGIRAADTEFDVENTGSIASFVRRQTVVEERARAVYDQLREESDACWAVAEKVLMERRAGGKEDASKWAKLVAQLGLRGVPANRTRVRLGVQDDSQPGVVYLRVMVVLGAVKTTHLPLLMSAQKTGPGPVHSNPMWAVVPEYLNRFMTMQVLNEKQQQLPAPYVTGEYLEPLFDTARFFGASDGFYTMMDFGKDPKGVLEAVEEAIDIGEGTLAGAPSKLIRLRKALELTLDG